MTRCAALGLAVAASLLVTSTSSAGPVEEVVQVAFHPSDPQRMVLHNEFGGQGLWYTDDGGATWKAVLCPAATKPPELERAPSSLGRMALANDGTLMVGVFGALLRDDGAGCGWAVDGPFMDQWVTDVVHHPTDPDVLFAITSLGGGADNGVYQRDASSTWEAIGTHEPILLNRLLVADLGGGALRFYALGSVGVWCGDTLCEDSQGCCAGAAPDAGAGPDGGAAPTCMPADGMCEFGIENSKPRFIIRVSDDMGTTWTDHDFGPTDAVKLVLDAVDPTNPDQIVIGVLYNTPGIPREGDPHGDEVMVSADQGASFTAYDAPMSLYGGAVFAPDGRLWVGGRYDSFRTETTNALYYAETLDPAQAPTLLTEDVQIRCLDYRADMDKLFVCERFDAGFLQPDGTGYEELFAFKDFDAFVECPGEDPAGMCDASYQEFCACSHFANAPVCCDASDLTKESVMTGCPENAPMCPDSGAGGTTTGGAGGVAGDPVTGGMGGMTGGAGGVAGMTGGAGGTAGTTPPTGGTAGAAMDTSKDDGGCGCRTVGTGRSRGMPALLLFATLLFGWRRLRRFD